MREQSLTFISLERQSKNSSNCNVAELLYTKYTISYRKKIIRIIVVHKQSSNYLWSGRDPGGAVRVVQSPLCETVRCQDAGDWVTRGHSDQLCRSQGHAALEDGGWCGVPAGGQLSRPLPPHQPPPPPHQEIRVWS